MKSTQDTKCIAINGSLDHDFNVMLTIKKKSFSFFKYSRQATHVK